MMIFFLHEYCLWNIRSVVYPAKSLNLQSQNNYQPEVIKLFLRVMRDIQQEHVFLKAMRENEWLSLKIQSIFYHALMVLGMIVNFEVLSKK